MMAVSGLTLHCRQCRVRYTDCCLLQYQVAGGRPLPQRQEELKLRGHAFEARVYAEDPKNNFMPGAGILQYLATPEPRTDLRIETGVRQGTVAQCTLTIHTIVLELI